ncbi:MAG: alpha-1,2-fucosyltransferase [Pseudomonadota bacterium]
MSQALEQGLRQRLATSPGDFSALVQLGQLLLYSGRLEEALSIADRAAALNPGHGIPFSLQAMVSARLRFGLPPTPKPAQAGAAVSMRTLGANGRFGNQLLQYAFLKLYARQHNLAAQSHDWIGRDLFGCDEPFPAANFPSLDESQADLFASLNGQAPVHANRDLSGYFCRHTSAWQDRADAFRALFQPRPALQDWLRPAMAELATRGNTLVAVHIRRGDFGQGQFWTAPTEWYASWLQSIWNQLDAPILYVASDDAGVAAEFSDFKPLDARNLGAGRLDFYLDHHVLSRSRHLAISNSSFSFTAAMLNENAKSFVRPDRAVQALVPFDPWNADVLLP